LKKVVDSDFALLLQERKELFGFRLNARPIGIAEDENAHDERGLMVHR
jgi:hypothetical protein